MSNEFEVQDWMIVSFGGRDVAEEKAAELRGCGLSGIALGMALEAEAELEDD